MSVRENGKTGPRPSRLVGNFPHPTLLRSPSFPFREHGACGLLPRFRGFPFSPGLSEPKTPWAPPSQILIPILIGYHLVERPI